MVHFLGQYVEPRSVFVLSDEIPKYMVISAREYFMAKKCGFVTVDVVHTFLTMDQSVNFYAMKMVFTVILALISNILLLVFESLDNKNIKVETKEETDNGIKQ